MTISINIFDNLIEELKVLISSTPKRKKLELPYFPQIATNELIEDIFTGVIDPSTDPNWQNTGAETTEEYKKWHHQMCGMACLKMILFYKFNKEFPIVTLAKKCRSYGGYVEKENNMDGLFYEPFCRFIKNEFNLESTVESFLSMKRIKSEISKENLVIVSVHPSIRNSNSSEPDKKGGHLVLMTGYDDIKKKFYLNNPSGFRTETQKDYEISYQDFKKFFAKRGIVVNA